MPVRLRELAEEHLANVRRHQAATWHLKQRHYLYRTEKDRPDSPQKSSNSLALRGSQRRSDIRAYIDHLRDGGLKAVTCNKVLSCLKAMFRFAEERGYVAENGHPARGVKLRGAMMRS